MSTSWNRLCESTPLNTDQLGVVSRRKSSLLQTPPWSILRQPSWKAFQEAGLLSETAVGGRVVQALITGISGFVGSHLADYLLNHTDWQVAGTVYGPVDNVTHLKDRLALYPAELSQPTVVSEVLQTTRPDYIFHLAAQPSPAVSRTRPLVHVGEQYPRSTEYFGSRGANRPGDPGPGGRLWG